MKIIRERYQTNGEPGKYFLRAKLILRTDTYEKSLGHLLTLFDEAKKDYPGLDPKDVSIVKYLGRDKSGTMGIEFDVFDNDSIPAHYQEIKSLEYAF